jgi:23S rRNA (adenine2503-C2)-methyltransferase
LTTRALFQLSRNKVIVSTVAPSPQSFVQFALAPCVLAWSVHAANDTKRRKLVPTTRYTMVELRQGLIDTLLLRPENFRTTMIEVALMDQINDSIQDADDMAYFVRGIIDAVPGCKLMVNLIPYNDHGLSNDGTNPKWKTPYRKPSMDRVLQYQQQLWSNGIHTHVRVTRGDDDSAACGQLVTTTTTTATAIRSKQQNQ